MNLVIAKDYNPHRAQVRFHKSRKRFICAAAGARGGKTKAGAVEFVTRIYRDRQEGRALSVSGYGGKRRRPNQHYWMVSPTAGLLREPIRYLFETIPQELIERYYESEHALWLKGGILIEFKTADNPVHLVASGLNGLWIDEAARVKSDAWRGQLRQRLSDRQGFGIFTSTPMGRNWLYEDIVERSGVDPEYETVQWTTADNPHIPAEEIESARRQLPKRYFDREYMASFDSFSGTIFNEFSEGVHVLSEQEFRLKYNIRDGGYRNFFRRVVAGVDWGWTSPGAIVVVGDLGGRYVVLDESYAPNRYVFDASNSSTTWISEARRFVDLYGVEQFKCDPEGASNTAEFRRAGLHAVRANNNVNFGIRKINEALHPQPGGGSRLMVLSRCKNLISEMQRYEWAPVKGTENFQETPMPNQQDHAVDAFRYAMAELMAFEGEKTESKPNAYHGPVY